MFDSYTLVISGGPMPYAPGSVSKYATKANSVICADSGVDTALRSGVNIDKVFGDLDSISSDGLNYIKSTNIPIEVFPCEKDMTDTELVLSSIPVTENVVLFCSLKGRIDHVMANIMLCSRYVTNGRRIVVTDGEFEVYFLYGQDSITYYVPDDVTRIVSLLPLDMSTGVTGVTTSGLYYELRESNLFYGSSLGVSNRVKENGKMFTIQIQSGIMGVLIGPEQ